MSLLKKVNFSSTQDYIILYGAIINTGGNPGYCLDGGLGGHDGPECSNPTRASIRVDLPEGSRVTRVKVDRWKEHPPPYNMSTYVELFDVNNNSLGRAIDYVAVEAANTWLLTDSGPISVPNVAYVVFYGGTCWAPVDLRSRIDNCIVEYETGPDEANNQGKPDCESGAYAGGNSSRNPVGLRHGEKQETTTDLRLMTPAGGLEFTRFFSQSSQTNVDSSMGLGWNHNHLLRLTKIIGSPNKISVRLSNGGEALFTETSTNHYVGVAGVSSVVDWNTTTNQYTLTTTDQATHVFDSAGKLLNRSWPSGESWAYSYDANGKLTQVQDGYGRKLVFRYYSTGSFAGLLYRVGDHTFDDTNPINPSGRYVQFEYSLNKTLNSAGAIVDGNGAVLTKIQDVRAKDWTYEYYGQQSGETDARQLNFLTRRKSPLVDTTGDGTPDESLTIEDVHYTLQSTERAVNGGMELDSDWTGIVGAVPSINERYSPNADTGSYSRHVKVTTMTPPNQGVEGAEFILEAGRLYVVSARVYVVNGTVKMQVNGIPAFDAVSSAVGVWHTLRVVHSPLNRITGRRLQFVASGGLAEFYVDTVSISEIIIQGIHQERGNSLLVTDFAFQPNGANTTTETIAGKVTTHHFFNGVYGGTEDPSQSGEYSYQVQDNNYRPNSQVDALGNTTQLSWSADGKWLTGVNDALDHQTNFSYNANDTLNTSVDAEGRRTEYVYGDSTNPRLPTIVRVRETDSPTAPVLREQQFSYDNKGRSLTEKLVDPTNPTTVLQQTTREYYTSGNGNGLLFRLKQHDAQQPGSTVDTEYTYDSAGRVIKTRQVSTFGSCQYSFTLYDAAGNVTRSVCSSTDLATPETAVTTADIKVTVHQYDTLGRRVQTISNYVDGVYNPSVPTEDQASLTVYDALDRVIRAITTYVPDASLPNPYTAAHSSFTHGSGQNQNLVSDTAYNARGMVRKQTDVLGNVTLFGYDAAGRLVKTVQSASNPGYNNDYTGSSPDPTLANYTASAAPDQDIITTSSYDPAGNLVRSVDVLGSQHFSVYDALNRPVKTVRSAKDSATVSLNPGDAGYDAANDPRSASYVPDSAADRDLIESSEYDAMGRVIRSTDGLGRVTRTVYDSLGRVSRSIANYVAQGTSDPANWVYDLPANLWRQASGGTAIDHGTRNDQNLISLTVYDASGRVLYTQDTLGRRTWQQYDGFGRVVKTVANAVGTATDGSANDPRSASYVPSGDSDKDRISTTQYDGNGRVIETQDALQRRSRSVYDGLGWVKKTVANCTGTGTAADQDSYVGSSNADDDLITKTEYDSFGRVFRTINALGRETRYVYDAAGRRSQTIVNYVDGVFDPAEPDRDLIQTSEYDLAGRVVKTTDARGTVTTFGYDRAGRRLWVTAAANTPLEATSITCYDKAGRGLRTIAGYVPLVDSAGQVISPDAKDGNGNWLFAPTTFGPHNDENLVTRFSYDRLGRRIEVFDPLGNATTTVYNKGGQVVSQSESGVAVRGTATTVTSRFVYDGLGRRWRVIQNYVAQGSSDPANWVWEGGAWKQAPGGTAIQHGSDNDQNVIVDVTHDRAGRVLSQREPRGHLTATSYDLLDRRTQLTNPLGASWLTSYEDLKTGGTANGRTRTTRRFPGLSGLANYDVRRDSDRMGRLASIDYNVTAPQTPFTTPNVSLSYDKLGSRLSLIEHNGVSNVRRTLFTPDQAGRVTQAQFDTDGNGTVDETVSYAYDAGGLRTRLTLPGGGQIDYGYNARGELTHLTDSDGQTSAFVYDRVGRLTGSERANGMTSRYQHDPAGRLRLLRHRVGNKLLASFQFEVDGRGNRVNAREVLARPATVTATIDRNHASVSYTGTWSDTGGFRRTTEFTARLSLTLSGQELRLVVGTGPDHGLCDVYVDGSLWETYDGYSVAAGERSLPLMLDKGGSHTLELRNRPDKRGISTGYVVRFKQVDVLATSYDQQTLVYAYDALARLRQAQYYAGVGVLSSPFRQYDYAFDRSGNRTQQVVTISGVPTTTNYTYNAANQLIQAGSTNLSYDSNGNMLNDGVNAYAWDRANRLLSMGGASYVYDGEGRRVQQTVSGVVTKYLLDMQPGLAVVLSATQGANVERYVHGPTGIFARKDSSNVWHWTEQDGLGTVRGEVDAFGGVEGSRTLDPFGNLIGAVNGVIGTPYGFTGELVDGGGLLDLRARRYASGLGVFGSLDPLETRNRYAYVDGNPANRVDPTGLQGICGASSEALPQIDVLTLPYVSVVKNQKQMFLDVAHRRRMELLDVIGMYRSKLMQAALSYRDCTLNSLLSKDNSSLLNSAKLERIFGITSDEEFAARMAAIPAIVNAAGWQMDSITGIGGGTLDDLQTILNDPTFIQTHSAGYLELRYNDDEFLSLLRGQSFAIGDLTVNLGPITQITERYTAFGPFYAVNDTNMINCVTSPESCFFSYVNPYQSLTPYDGVGQSTISSSGLAEIAGANLLRRYLEYLQQWSQADIKTRDIIDDWSLADPMAYAAYCSRAGSACSQIGVGHEEQGWGTQTEQTVLKYDIAISYFRYVFDPDGSRTLSSCMLKPSEVSRLTNYP